MPGLPGQGPREPQGPLDDYLQPPPTGGAGSRRPWALAVAIVAVLAVAVLGARKLDGRPGPDKVQPSPAALQPQAAWDGKQSRRLPVTVTPNTGLHDGQTVIVHGSGFPRGTQVAVVVCTIAAGSVGVSACDISTSSFMAGNGAVASSDGEVTVSYKMQRFITVGGTTVDCQTGNVDPRLYGLAVAQYGPWAKITTPGAFSCLLAASDINNYDISGGALVGMAGSTFVPFTVDKTPQTTTTSSAPTTIAPSATIVTPASSTTVTAPDIPPATVIVPPPTDLPPPDTQPGGPTEPQPGAG